MVEKTSGFQTTKVTHVEIVKNYDKSLLGESGKPCWRE